MSTQTCDLASWRLDIRAEPVIRIGVVLPADAMQSIRIIVPDLDYTLLCDGRARTTLRRVRIEALVHEDGVAVRANDAVVGAAREVTLSPAGHAVLERGAGLCLQGVIAGRGFHWQKRIHPTLSGDIEIRAHAGALLVINELPLEPYLAGVIAGEMSGRCPIAFLKSQCIVARAWVLARTESKHADLPIHRCNDDCCQRYLGTLDLTESVLEAVRSTRGQVLVADDGAVLDANYAKCCGGITEAPEHVWFSRKPGLHAAVDAPEGSDLHGFMPVTEDNLEGYLRGSWIETTDAHCGPNVVPREDLGQYLGKVDESADYFRWRLRYHREELEQIINQKLPATGAAETMKVPMQTLTDLRVLSRGASGRANLLAVDYLDTMNQRHTVEVRSEYTIRDVLHPQFLFSSAFRPEIIRDDEGIPRDIILHGAGWGHGAGLCQIGALGMALKGHADDAILHHYYQNVTLKTCY